MQGKLYSPLSVDENGIAQHHHKIPICFIFDLLKGDRNCRVLDLGFGL